MPEQVRRVVWRVVGAIVAYNLVLGLAIFWVAGRTKDRFTGAEGRAAAIERADICRRIAELEEHAFGQRGDCKISGIPTH